MARRDRRRLLSGYGSYRWSVDLEMELNDVRVANLEVELAVNFALFAIGSSSDVCIVVHDERWRHFYIRVALDLCQLVKVATLTSFNSISRSTLHL